MGIQWVWGLHLVFLSIFLVATKYTCLGAQYLTVACHERERLALLEFKHSVKDDFGMLSSWVGIDCCSWKGVLCDAATGSVASLQLKGNYGASFYYYDEDGYYLVGEKVNTYLAELGHLRHLDLSGNNFQGSQIPEFIGSFKQLSCLNLSNAGFIGIIPHHIGNLSGLKVLDLGTSSLLTPDDMSWVSGLSSLQYLDLSYVDFRQAKNANMVLYMIPSLIYLSLSSCELSNDNLGLHLNSSKILPNIKYLDLSNNSFKGQLPHFFENMTSLTFLDLSYFNLSLARNSLNLLNMIPSLSELYLYGCGLHNTLFSPTYLNSSAHSNIQYLDLGYNSFHGRFLSDIINMTSLRVLDLSVNGLTGSIPDSLGRLTNLRALYLRGNSLTGPIPTFHRKLTELDLAFNQFSGSIPESMGRLTSLTYLCLEVNELTGPIPTSIGRLSSLQSFSVSHNLLNGTLPVSVWQLTKLALLDVSYNSLEGVVLDANFSNLSSLIDLDTTSNHNLTLSISNEWIPPFQLRSVSLSSCKIGNEIPQWLQTQRKLKHLELSNASLHGILPTWLSKMHIISHLDLSHNKLSGPLINLPFKIHINKFDSEQYLFLQDNLFNGSIPRSLCRRTHLQLLDISGNKLSGNIPKCLGNLQDMVMLILGSNGLSGALPSSLGNISSLEWLKLNDNNFKGELPQDLSKLRSLRSLDLGNNGLFGNIPKWIGENLTKLMVLRLPENNFTGGIPQSLCKCSYLQILDVAHNNLTGSIPHCFGELSGMIKVRPQDFSSNTYEVLMFQVRNEIQVMKGMNLEYTDTLDFVFNMDLSSNKLTGEIPPELTTLALLVGLNLSHNHISGRIPDSIRNMKALNSLDFSDNQFTGMIPPSMAALNFLSSLNLSHNNLSGQIPTGNQLQTLTDPSIYAGNRDLCGTPLPNNCSNHENPPTTKQKKYKDADQPKTLWFYLDVMCGFATGFWGIIGVLLLKKQWIQKLFMIAEVTMDKVFVAVAVRVSKFKRGREAI